MIHIRTNRAGTSVELLKVEEVAFIRGKLDDRKYKTQVFLKCGTIIHMNLDKDELQNLRSAFENVNGYECCDKAEQIRAEIKPITISEAKRLVEESTGLASNEPDVTLDNLITDLQGQE
jgi:hypothetical protein